MANRDKDAYDNIEYLQGRLYYASLTHPPTHPKKHFFTIDDKLVYWNFFLDFGPLNLGQLYKFCLLLNGKLSDPKLKDKVIYFYSGNHPHKRANAAFLISAWAMLCLNKSPEDSFRPFCSIENSFTPWHDATPILCTFKLTIMDTLQGLYKARLYSFFDFNNFDVQEYDHFTLVENGDLTWVLDGKFIAFAGPHEGANNYANGIADIPGPHHFVPYFQRKNVKLVVRLNKVYYNDASFTSKGIDHMELYFLDGSNPPPAILAAFLSRCENVRGAVAVHCKAGLGRTGTCIGCYMMKHYRLTAEEVIGWLRIARPGSIIGPQQHFMKEMQDLMWQDGETMRMKFHELYSARSSNGHTIDDSYESLIDDDEHEGRNKDSALLRYWASSTFATVSTTGMASGTDSYHKNSMPPLHFMESTTSQGFFPDSAENGGAKSSASLSLQTQILFGRVIGAAARLRDQASSSQDHGSIRLRHSFDEGIVRTGLGNMKREKNCDSLDMDESQGGLLRRRKAELAATTTTTTTVTTATSSTIAPLKDGAASGVDNSSKSTGRADDSCSDASSSRKNKKKGAGGVKVKNSSWLSALTVGALRSTGTASRSLLPSIGKPSKAMARSSTRSSSERTDTSHESAFSSTSSGKLNAANKSTFASSLPKTSSSSSSSSSSFPRPKYLSSFLRMETWRER